MDDFGTMEQIGWTYQASLHLHTPLEVLQQHGRSVSVDGIRIEYGQSGMWTPLYHRTGVYATAAADTIWSCGGQVPVDGGDVLPFLVAYRTIVEDESIPVRERVAAVRELTGDPRFARWIRMLGDGVATDWVASRLASELNIGAAPANSLVRNGCFDVADVLALADVDLQAMRGVGAKTIAMIRLARRSANQRP
jgi:hypothetical protein